VYFVYLLDLLSYIVFYVFLSCSYDQSRPIINCHWPACTFDNVVCGCLLYRAVYHSGLCYRFEFVILRRDRNVYIIVIISRLVLECGNHCCILH